MQVADKKKIKIIVLLIAVLVFVAFAIFLPVGIVYGLFSDNKNLSPNNPSDIIPPSIEVIAWFEPPGKEQVQLGNSHSLFNVELNDSSKDNYLGYLRVNINFSGNIHSMLRLSIYHFWAQEGGTSPNRANINFFSPTCHVVNSFYNNDNSLYFCRTSDYDANDENHQSFVLTEKDKGSISFITGINQNIRYESTVTLSLMLTANLIQANRLDEFWGGLPVPSDKIVCPEIH